MKDVDEGTISWTDVLKSMEWLHLFHDAWTWALQLLCDDLHQVIFDVLSFLNTAVKY